MRREAQLLQATAKTSNPGGSQKVSDLRYASLKRYLAKRFHPDYAPGEGIEKIVRNEIFKEIWNELSASIKESRVPALRRGNPLQRPKRAISPARGVELH